MNAIYNLNNNTSNEDTLTDAEALSVLEHGTESSELEVEHTTIRKSPSCIDWSALRAPIPERLWWMADWLSPAPTLIAGAGGKGKSMLMQGIATSLATGTEYITPVPVPATCLMWSCEDDEQEILRRQVRLVDYFHLAPEALGRLHVSARAGEDNVLFDLQYGRAKPTRLFRLLREQVNDLRVEVLILDNISHIYGGVSCESHQVTAFVNAIFGLVNGRPFAPIFVGHVARTQGSEFAGAAAWENAVRMRWFLGSTKPAADRDESDQYEEHKLYFSRRKTNYSPTGDVELTRVDGVLVPDSSPAKIAARTKRAADVDTLLLTGLDELLKRGAGATDKRGSQLYLPSMLRQKGLAGDASQGELSVSLDRLLANGRLTIGYVGKYSNGTDKFGPIPASLAA